MEVGMGMAAQVEMQNGTVDQSDQESD